MSLFDNARTPPARDSAGTDNDDTVRADLDAMRALAKEVGAADDRFADDLATAIDGARKAGEALRSAHFKLADHQDAALRVVAKGVEEAQRFQATNGPRGATKIDAAAAMKEAARRTATAAVVALASDVLPLADQAAQAGRDLEQRIARAQAKWRAGLGRAEQIDDVVAIERMRSMLSTKSTADVLVFVSAMLGDTLDDREWSVVDTVARSLAADTMKQTRGADRVRPRADSAFGPALAVAQKIIAALDAETERRTPASIALATEALGHYKAVFAKLAAKNAAFMSAPEYRKFRDGGATSLAEVLTAWSVDPNWASRFLAPNAWRCPGWSPVLFTDRTTGGRVRAPR